MTPWDGQVLKIPEMHIQAAKKRHYTWECSSIWKWRYEYFIQRHINTYSWSHMYIYIYGYLDRLYVRVQYVYMYISYLYIYTFLNIYIYITGHIIQPDYSAVILGSPQRWNHHGTREPPEEILQELPDHRFHSPHSCGGCWTWRGVFTLPPNW